MIRQYELAERVKSYDPGADEAALNRAYVFALKAHGAQIRASGDSYFSHPLEVAGILTDYHLDHTTIITALLHDTIEDTAATLDDIRGLFGDEIARLVDGVTKLSRIELQSDHTKQAENFRKLVLAMSEDIRVLLVKLADRLHNMRTLGHIENPETRRRIALETMEIYAPLAGRVGMHKMKDELDDLAFAELYPEARASVLTRLEFLRREGGGLAPEIIFELERTLARAGVKSQVSGREKGACAIWRKMQRKNVSFEQLSDVMAFRVIVDFTEECYRSLGAIHTAYRVVPNRFKDYVSTPKPNGYRSIHTTVIGPFKQRVEIQIRTREFHEVAENGVAAHWLYKQGIGKTEGRQYRWLRELLEILEQTSAPNEFLENTKLEMFQDQVFCFTPKGDLIALPAKATPVDFAYAVHSEIGDTCVGAKINGRIMPLRTILQNGDQVEIVTSKAQTPSPTWERFVVTGKARACILRFIHSKEREQYMELGGSILKRAFAEAGYELSTHALEGVLKVFKLDKPDDLMSRVGAGHITGRDVVEAVYPGTKRKRRGLNPFRRSRAPDPEGVASVPIRGLIPGMAMHFAECCHPLPGDRIVGILTEGQGVMIHTIDCDHLADLSDAPERWLDLSWDENTNPDDLRVGRIVVTVRNQPGTLGDLSTLIARNDGNIQNIKITNRSADFFDFVLDIEVRDVLHLSDIIAALRASPAISAVERLRR